MCVRRVLRRASTWKRTTPARRFCSIWLPRTRSGSSSSPPRRASTGRRTSCHSSKQIPADFLCRRTRPRNARLRCSPHVYFNMHGLKRDHPADCSNVYGPRGRPDMMPFKLMRACVDLTSVVDVFDNGEIKRDWDVHRRCDRCLRPRAQATLRV